MMQTVDAQPETVLPKTYCTKVHTTPKRLKKDTKNPKNVIIRMGFVERLVMPSMAKASIFFSG